MKKKKYIVLSTFHALHPPSCQHKARWPAIVSRCCKRLGMKILDFSGKMVTSSRKISNPYWDTEKKHITTTMIVMLELASSIVYFCKPSTGEVCNTAKMNCAFSSWPNSRKIPPSSPQLIIGELIYYFIFETKMLIEKLKDIWTLFKHVKVKQFQHFFIF